MPRDRVYISLICANKERTVCKLTALCGHTKRVNLIKANLPAAAVAYLGFS